MKHLELLYPSIKNNHTKDLYLTLEMFSMAISHYDTSHLKKNIIGQSEEGRGVVSYTWGNGPQRILMWSQMHGNEPTTTKALLDLFNYLNHESSQWLSDKVTLCMIPILNPDGAHYYTRVNANKVDLNRDAQNKTQKESRLLLDIYGSFKPDYGFNLHQQRTIFGLRNLKVPSILSFLTPATDEKREINPQREKSMQVISDIFNHLKLLIPNKISRFDDSFNLNCFGDTFQSLGMPTLLFEAGYDSGDHSRDITREMMFYAIVKGMESIANEDSPKAGSGAYFDIPQAEKCFYDVIIRNIKCSKGEEKDLAIQYKEVLEGTKISFLPVVENLGNLSDYCAHTEVFYNCNNFVSFEHTKIGEILSSNPLLDLIELPDPV